MALPAKKVNLYERRIVLLKKRIENLQAGGSVTRTHYGNIVAKHLADNRGLRNQVDDLTTAAIQDRFKLQDFEAQIANQWRENAELRDDLARAKLMHDAKAKELQYSQGQYRNQITVVERIERDIALLQRNLTNRIWVAMTTQVEAWRVVAATRRAKIALAFSGWKSRVVHRFMIRRLSKARVAALYEAGHIPDKLVRSALAYYEHDKKRLDLDEQIQDIHYGRDHTTIVKETRPPLWRRFKIWMGRA
jgi:hypothetical protein